MSHPRCGWWGYVKHMIRRYPYAVNENERAAIQAALAETKGRPAGAERLRVVDMVLFRRSHTLAGAALLVHISERTAQRYHGEFLHAVGRHFSCTGLE